MHRRPEFSFPGSPSPASRGQLPPRPLASHPMAAARRYGDDDEEVRWLQASLQASPDPDYYSHGGSGSGSGTPSPQLWAQSPQSHHQQLHRQYPASAGSSPSRDRAQAIAGYRREMLDLVRGLPESAYELSLRDIVEHRHRPSSPPSPPSPPRAPPSPTPPPTAPSTTAGRHHASRGAVAVPVPAGAQEKDEPAAVPVTATADSEDSGGSGNQQGGGSRGKEKQGRSKQRTTVTRKQRSRSMERSVSLDTGLLIKLFLPLSIGGKKKKVSVSPKPDDSKKKKKREKLKQGNKKKEEAVPAAQEEEWWSKSEYSEARSSSRTSSTGSSNSNSSSAASVRNGVHGGATNPRAPARSWSRKRTGCYAFFRANKGKNGVNQY